MRNSLWITLPTQSCLTLYSFGVYLLHLPIMWLMILSLSPHNLHLLFCFALSIFTFGEFFAPGLAGDLSLKFEQQHVSSDFQDTSKYSSRFWQCCGLDVLDSSSGFQFLQLLLSSLLLLLLLLLLLSRFCKLIFIDIFIYLS